MVGMAAAASVRSLQPLRAASVAPARSRRGLKVFARKTAAKTAYICIDCKRPTGWWCGQIGVANCCAESAIVLSLIIEAQNGLTKAASGTHGFVIQLLEGK